MSEQICGASAELINLFAWAAQAKPGERVVYCRGNLAGARYLRGKAARFDKDVEVGLDAACYNADDAMVLANQGKVLLLQRRHAAEDYEYIAVRSRAA